MWLVSSNMSSGLKHDTLVLLIWVQASDVMPSLCWYEFRPQVWCSCYVNMSGAQSAWTEYFARTRTKTAQIIHPVKGKSNLIFELLQEVCELVSLLEMSVSGSWQKWHTVENQFYTERESFLQTGKNDYDLELEEIYGKIELDHQPNLLAGLEFPGRTQFRKQHCK